VAGWLDECRVNKGSELDFIHSKPKKEPQKALFLGLLHFFAGGSKELTGANVKGEQQAFHRLNLFSTTFMGLPKHFRLRP
jgi:hypothetical protein